MDYTKLIQRFKVNNHVYDLFVYPSNKNIWRKTEH